MLSSLFAVSTLVVGFVCGNENTCLFDSTKVTKNLATKAPYHHVTDPSRRQTEEQTFDALQLWLLARHGTRYPSNSGLEAMQFRLPELIKSIKENHVAGRGSLCPDDLKVLEQWVTNNAKSLNSTKIMEKHLHPEGEVEHILMAERFRNRFPGLLPVTYNETKFRFRSTDTERAQKSQLYFATGLFDRFVAQMKVRYSMETKHDHDSLLRFYKLCRKWLLEVKTSPSSIAEHKAFGLSDFFAANLIVPLSQRLGFQANLTLNQIEDIYVACYFGQAWNYKVGNPLCQLFSDSELQMMEYREDLEYYWQDGYAFDINYQQACVLMKDVVENFEKVIMGNSTEKGLFYFSHSGAILKFLTFLGLYKDQEHLTATNYVTHGSHRLYRTSTIDPFSSNIAFVITKDFRVSLYHNEELVRIPGCSELKCKFMEMKSLFSERLSNCIIDQICKSDSTVKLDQTHTADDRY